MRSKFQLSKWKTYFSQFIDKYLKTEEVEYLIHYVEFTMWPALFYSLLFPFIPSVFPASLNFGVKLYIIFPNLHRDWQLGLWMLL